MNRIALPSEQKFNEGLLLTMTALELSTEDTIPSQELTTTNWLYTLTILCTAIGAIFESFLPGKQ
jgi:hypothetical protein